MDYWLVITGDPKDPGIDGGIYLPQGEVNGIVNTIQVSDVGEYIEKVRKAGGDTVGDIQEIPKGGKFIYAKDVESNYFGIMQPVKGM